MNIILNLLMNCVDNTKKGYIIIHIYNNNDHDEVYGAIKVHIRDTANR